MATKIDLLADVSYPDGQDNMAGITKTGYIALVSAFTTIATPDTDAVGAKLEDIVKIKTPHVLGATKKVYKLFVMYEKSGVESTSVGGRKAKSWKPKLKFFYCGTEAEILGFVTLIQNADLLAFAQPLDGTGLIQVGSEELPASLVAGSVKTGEGPEGEKGVSFEIEAPGRTPWYIYDAVLPLVGA